MSRTFVSAVLAIAAAVAVQPLLGCAKAGAVASGPAPSSLSSPPSASDEAQHGLAFAQRHCSGCHAVTENRLSPEPEAPPFEDIANRPGVDGATLRQFLKDSHNYPAAMNFHIEEAEIAALADHIESLRKSGYRPLP